MYFQIEIAVNVWKVGQWMVDNKSELLFLMCNHFHMSLTPHEKTLSVSFAYDSAEVLGQLWKCVWTLFKTTMQIYTNLKIILLLIRQEKLETLFWFNVKLYLIFYWYFLFARYTKCTKCVILLLRYQQDLLPYVLYCLVAIHYHITFLDCLTVFGSKIVLELSMTF